MKELKKITNKCNLRFWVESFCYKGDYCDNWQSWNRVCGLNGNNTLLLIAWLLWLCCNFVGECHYLSQLHTKVFKGIRVNINNLLLNGFGKRNDLCTIFATFCKFVRLSKFNKIFLNKAFIIITSVTNISAVIQGLSLA